MLCMLKGALKIFKLPKQNLQQRFFRLNKGLVILYTLFNIQRCERTWYSWGQRAIDKDRILDVSTL